MHHLLKDLRALETTRILACLEIGQTHRQVMHKRQRLEAPPHRQSHRRENLRQLQYVSMYNALRVRGASRR